MDIEARKRLSGWMRSSNAFLAAVAILLCLLVLSYALHKRFDHDEFEHVHSAWYVANGYAPYADFFQVHHPLWWYLVAPVLLVLGYSAHTVIALRVVMFGLTVAIAATTYLIARRVTESTNSALLSVVLLLSMVMFLSKSLEIRPDVPQVLLGLISVYFLLSYLQTGRRQDVILAGLTASLSFLFLQKTVFLLIAYAIVLSFALLRRKISFRSAFLFAISFSLPVLFFLGYLLLSGAMSEYLVSNWLLHATHIEPYSPLRHVWRSFTSENALFWLLVPVSTGYVLLNRKTHSRLKTTAFLGAALLLSVWLLKRPHRQNFLLSIPLLCIPMAHFLESVAARFRRRGVCIGVLVLLILVQPLASLVPELRSSRNRDKQLERVDYVFNNTTESDLVYDGNIRFNLFRLDLHYFWFSVEDKYPAQAYSRVSKDKYGDYNICDLIKSKHPLFISDYELDITTCGLRALYDPTAYEGIYVLRQAEGVEQTVWRDFGGVAALVGYDIQIADEGQERRMKVSLRWRALATSDVDYTVFVHLLGPEQTMLAQLDEVIQLKGRTTSNWEAGQEGIGEYELSMPTVLPKDGYSVVVGVYYWQTGERLPVWDERGERLSDDTVSLQTVTMHD
jgi:hypothetical protein